MNFVFRRHCYWPGMEARQSEPLVVALLSNNNGVLAWRRESTFSHTKVPAINNKGLLNFEQQQDPSLQTCGSFFSLETKDVDS
jgi:hypothetical protein